MPLQRGDPGGMQAAAAAHPDDGFGIYFWHVSTGAIATGAGWEMRRSLGVAVFSGMIGVTLFGIFLTPVFYYVISWLGERKKPAAPPSKAPEAAPV